MTTLATSIVIDAPPARIFALAAAVERWPLILPHYRYVRLHEAEGTRRIVEMAAWRHVFPLHWVAELRSDPHVWRLTFRHLAGPVRGMDVEWRLDPAGTLTHVTIEHRIPARWPLPGEWVERVVVGGYFIDGVARRTLACMKAAAEST